MNRKISLLLLSLILLGGMGRAQTPMAIPNGSFEQWSSHSGYSVMVLIFPLSVYDTFSTPSVWSYPSYPVNETVTFMGMSVTINTSIPIVKTTRETGTVPDGSKAVKLHTIMIDDIVNSTVLSLAGDNIDSTLTQQVVPSLLLTGEVDVNAMMPILSNMAGGASISTMINTLLAEDVNDFISGGIALGDFQPGRLTGSYKYHSAVGGDNGAVMMIGTRYNTVTHRREVVGGGYTLDLTDTGVYTPFEVPYLPLDSLVPGSPVYEPDSLIVLLFSSAGENMQQGSYLILDNLNLWPAVSTSDTCAAITALTATPDIHEALLGWSVNDSVEGFEVEYGTAGFIPGSGTPLITTTPSVTLIGLDANTAYEARIRTLCADSVYGDWDSVLFTTLTDTCASVLDLSMRNTVYDAFPEMVLEWRGSSTPDHWEVEYGPQGFVPGTGTVMETEETFFDISELEVNGNLSPNTWYDFYVRSVCDGNVYGAWDSVQYRTFCAMVGSLTVDGDSLSVTADNRIDGYSASWVDTTDTRQWGVYYGIYSSEFPDTWGTYVTVDTPYFAFPPLRPDRQYTITVSAHCGDDNYGDQVWASFHTPALEGINNAPLSTFNPQLSISPNPAQGQCTVTFSDSHPVELKLYTIEGREIQTVTTDGTPVVLTLPAPGLYLLHATTSTGTTTYKIVSR